ISRSGPPYTSGDLLDPLYYLRLLCATRVPVILDRHPLISEPIYGPIVRGKSLVDPPFTRERALHEVASTATRVIYCRTDIETAKKASRRERQMEGVHEQYWALYQAYDKYMEDLARLGKKIISYDWTFDQSKDLNQLFLGA